MEDRGDIVVVSVVIDADMCNHIEWPATFLASGFVYWYDYTGGFCKSSWRAVISILSSVYGLRRI